MSNFRFPEGVDFEGNNDAGDVTFKVSIPVDDDGFFGRECPECEQHFRIAIEDYEALPDDLRLWCVYCGHHEDHSEFMTRQQTDRVMRAASDYAQQLVGQMLDKRFGGLAHRTRGSMIRLSYRSRPFYPAPLPNVDEERLVRQRICGRCSLRYAIFGEHRFCPVCGQLPPLVTALDALDAEILRLDALAELPDTVRATLRESGVLDRTYVDTIENLVGTVESLAERVFRSAVPKAEESLRGKGKVFQRLDDLADLWSQHLGVDVRAALGPEWQPLIRTWAARHVFTHCDGIIDAKYLIVVPESSQRPGQRLRISESQARAAISNTEILCQAVAAADERL